MIEKMNNSKGKVFNKDNSRVLYVTSDSDPTAVVAYDVIISNGNIFWYDGYRMRGMLIGQIVKDEMNEFIFKRRAEEGGGRYTFIPMTVEIAKTKLKDLIDKDARIESEEDIIKYFKND